MIPICQMEKDKEEIKVTGRRCEKIPEQEFDKRPEIFPGWEELLRKNGYVYIIYRQAE